MHKIMFRDRNGTEITKERWAQLLRNAKYCTLAREKIGDYIISATWLGVHSTREKVPKIFILSVVRNYIVKNEKGEKIEEKESFDYWYKSEKDTMARYDKVIMEHLPHD